MRSSTKHVSRVGDQRIGWTETGIGPPVVLVHGLGTAGTWWTPTIPALAASHRVLAVDLVGFGASRGQPVRLDAASEQLAAWAASIGLERSAWVGHSMGGLVAADLAARHPQLVERLVLVDSAGLALPQRVSRHLRNVLRGGRSVPVQVYPIAAVAAFRAGPLTIARAAHQILATDLAGQLRRIVAPTLVVWGEHDTLLPVAFGRRVAAAIPGARFVPIPDAGHSPMWEQPAAFARTIAAFLDVPAGELSPGDRPAPGVLAAPATPAASEPTTSERVMFEPPGSALTASTGGRVTSRYLDVRNLTIHARVGRPDERVETPPIVLVHGWVLSSRSYVPLMRRLARRHLVVAPDLPGFGWSGKPERVLDVAGLAEALIATMDAAGIGRAVLVGNSLGSQVAAQVAVDYPDRVLATVLTAPSFDPGEPRLRGHVLRAIADIPHEWPSLLLEHIPDLLLAGLPRAAATLRHAWAHRIETVLPLVRVPTTVIRGAHDPLVPRAWAQHAASLVPLGRAIEVGPAGHVVQDRRPDAVAMVVEDVVTSVSDVTRAVDDKLPIHIVTATHRRRPAARRRRTPTGPRRA